ncbi:hypothetical protein T06_12626, partial [Trichinella sp. T6]
LYCVQRVLVQSLPTQGCKAGSNHFSIPRSSQCVFCL